MEQTRSLMELNFFAPLAMAQLVAPHMRARRSGTIVNVSSIGGKMTLPWMTIYSASKAGLGALTARPQRPRRLSDTATHGLDQLRGGGAAKTPSEP